MSNSLTHAEMYRCYREDHSVAWSLRQLWFNSRLYGCWCLLRGKTIVYRATIVGGVTAGQGAWIKDTRFIKDVQQ